MTGARATRVLLTVMGVGALVMGAAAWLDRGDSGAEVVAGSIRHGQKTIDYRDVRVAIPADWHRSDMDGCEFRVEHWAAPQAHECGVGSGLAFYASATFDPAHGPGIVRQGNATGGDGSSWAGYVDAGDVVVYVAHTEREVVQQVLDSVRWMPGFDELDGPELITVDGGVRIVARTDMMISTHPLGDVVIGPFGVGMRGTATCFVPEANTNTGAEGTAVKIALEGGVAGYVPVEVTEPETGDQIRYLEQGQSFLRSRLPEC
jgi:hypothetical protein